MFLEIPEASEPMEGDRIWARYQPFLRHRGYELRPRYQPDWQPSWKGKVKDELWLWGKYEDSLELFVFDTFTSGLVFMHERRMIHHDACLLNIMMDPSKIVPGGFHFARWDTTNGLRRKTLWKERWSVRPMNYCFIDFETSFRYPPLSDPSTRHMIVYDGPTGQDKTVPEFNDGSKFYDGFKVDVYQVGNALRRVSVCYEDLSIFDSLFSAMTCSDPEKRVSAAESYQIFRGIVDSWSEKQLAKRIWLKGATRWNRFLIRHFSKKNVAQVLPSYIDFESPNRHLDFL
ncbi:hypothetical protein BJ912DRAFT_984451 [Pholiota molesta]|nr:hypothetical protein BJ912DRAFT_984451 [Pholiota molesta]